jgi:histidine triad (HIT) family protein
MWYELLDLQAEGVQMAQNCVFCKMVDGSIPVARIYEDDLFIGIKDIAPQAKMHFLIFPKEHLISLTEAFPAEGRGRTDLLGKMIEAGTLLARKNGIAESGFRLVINTQADAGQTVFHLHSHILGGEPLRGSFGK